MPELPEVETVRRGLEPVMTGRVIEHADIRRRDLRWPLPRGMASRLTGQTVLQLRRRAKYILADLSSGETLIIHLGMSGRMLVSKGQPGAFPLPGKHDHIILDMAGDARITFNDARRFGMMDLCATTEVNNHRMIAGLGPEPLGNYFHPEHLHTRLEGRRTPIKSALLDQSIVAGLGNIYVCEALWRSAISPRRLAANIGRTRCQVMVREIREVLTDAIAAGGSSLRDHRQTNGELGYFQHHFAAYGREGKPCRKPDCTGKIARIVQSGRSTFFCPRCQR